MGRMLCPSERKDPTYEKNSTSVLEKTFVPGAKEETVPRREPEAAENGAKGTADEVSGQTNYVVRCADGQFSVVATLPETSSDMAEAKEAKGKKDHSIRWSRDNNA